MSDDGLFMVQCELDRRFLVELARRRKIPLRGVDEGYLAHLGLRVLFGDSAPQPFSVQGQGRVVSVLGYSALDKDGLLRAAQVDCDPIDFEILHAGSVAAKPMPRAWPSGHMLAFGVRICPVIRKSAAGKQFRKGAEVDAFLSRCWEVGEGVPVNREDVYLDWFRTRVETDGAVKVHRSRVVKFARERLSRSDHRPNRRMVPCERPDVTLEGVLEVLDGDRFSNLLARGVGRHRAFGFGMLLARTPGRDPGC